MRSNTDNYDSALDQVIEERVGGTSASNLKFQYVWSEAYLDALVARDQYSGGVETQRLYAQHDENYDTTALVDTTGTVQERYLYDPYGVVTVTDANYNPRSQSAFGWQYLHQGGRLDPVTGWYNSRNRDLIPTEGRWAERDPLGFAGGSLDLYGNEGGNPTNFVDPSGMDDVHPMTETVPPPPGFYGPNIDNRSTTQEGKDADAAYDAAKNAANRQAQEINGNNPIGVNSLVGPDGLTRSASICNDLEILKGSVIIYLFQVGETAVDVAMTVSDVKLLGEAAKGLGYAIQEAPQAGKLAYRVFRGTKELTGGAAARALKQIAQKANLTSLQCASLKVTFTQQMLAKSTTIAQGTAIDKVGRLVELFGGTAKGWVKKKGWNALGQEIHWYEHNGIGRIGAKLAGQPDPF